MAPLNGITFGQSSIPKTFNNQASPAANNLNSCFAKTDFLSKTLGQKAPGLQSASIFS